MIGSIRGQITYKKDQFVIIDAHGVGYQIFVNTNNLSKLDDVGQEATLFTFLSVKEDSLTLFGFSSTQELDLFNLLISVNGVGPKMGLVMLDLGPVNEMLNAIAREDAEFLTRVPGIGKKTAQRIILELKGKVASIEMIDNGGPSIEHDVYDALLSLGYKTHEIREVIDQIDPTITDLSEKVRAALKVIKG